MKEQRYKGYVIGSDEKSDKKVWKLRVKDRSCSCNGKKLVVVSIHGDLELAKGLNVNFAIGSMDTPDGGQFLRAVDVRLEEPSEE